MSLTRPRIAVVDDDAGVRAAVADLLHAADFSTRSFASAEAFLARDGQEHFDCLVADINLPGLSGVALLQALGENGSRLPVVLITGRDDPATLDLIRRAGSVPLLRKPFGDDELFDAIRRAITAA